MKKLFTIILQVLFFCALSAALDASTDALHIKIPGSIIGIFVVFFLLQTKIIPLKWLDLGASWLIAELLLFFVPSAVGIINYKDLLVSDGWRIIIVILIGTVIVMACSGLLAKKISERKGK